MADLNDSLGSETLEPQPVDFRWVLKTALPFLLVGVVFAGAFYRVWTHWTAPEGYYTHGPLILFIAAFFVLRKRRDLTGEAPPEIGPLYAGGIGAGILYFIFNDFGWDTRYLFAILCAASLAYLVWHLRKLEPQPCRYGLLLLVPALLLCVFTTVQEVVTVAWFFALVSVVGLVLYYLGKRVTRLLIFPLIFLFTSVPLPDFLIERVTVPLKTFATKNTTTILQSGLCGITCERQGNRIFLIGADGETRDIVVGSVCSGLRSLVALITFGLLFAYITPLSMPLKTVLFLASIPASFIGNQIRIMVLALVTYQWDVNIATGDKLWTSMEPGLLGWLVPHLRRLTNEPVHDVTGILIFVFVFIVLFALERPLLWIENRRRRGTAADSQQNTTPEAHDA